MARLPRRHVPLESRCRVALRQLGELWPESVLAGAGSRSRLLADLLGRLAPLLGCEVADLRLDHDPALALRRWLDRQGRPTTDAVARYVPDEHDPEHLAYRPHGAEHAGSHDVKTRIRGDHGQYPDRVLIKRRRRMERAEAAASTEKERPDKRKPKVVKRPAKKSWGSRPLRSASRWPPKGVRKIGWKKGKST